MSDAASSSVFGVDLTTSSITIEGRAFPAAGALCPREEGNDEPDVELLLGGSARPRSGPAKGLLSVQALIPCENGVLIQIEWSEERPGVCGMGLCARTCELSHWPDRERPMWLPYSVAVYQGTLTIKPPGRRGIMGSWEWHDAEPDWTVEFIDRVAVMPFTEPPGPRIRLIPLKEAEEMLAERNKRFSQ